jgi:hypothetical protein
MSEKPEDPNFDRLEQELGLSFLDEEAFHMYEMFKSLLRAGFRERQALILVAMLVNEADESAVYYVKEDDDEEEAGDGVK